MSFNTMHYKDYDDDDRAKIERKREKELDEQFLKITVNMGGKDIPLKDFSDNSELILTALGINRFVNKERAVTEFNQRKKK